MRHVLCRSRWVVSMNAGAYFCHFGYLTDGSPTQLECNCSVKVDVQQQEHHENRTSALLLGKDRMQVQG